MIPLTRPFGWNGHVSVCLCNIFSRKCSCQTLQTVTLFIFFWGELYNEFVFSYILQSWLGSFLLAQVGLLHLLCILVEPTWSTPFGMFRSDGKNGTYFQCDRAVCVCVCVCKHVQSDVCVRLDMVVGQLFSPSVCLLQDSSHEIFKVQWKLICRSEVCFSLSLSLSDQIPMELHRRGIVISHVSEMTKFRASKTAAAQRWSSDQWNTVGDTMDHTHTLIRPSDWISHGCLDH